MSRRKRAWMAVHAAAIALCTLFTGVASATGSGDPLSDAALVRTLPGDFHNGYARVNGTRLHYVAGGHGRPLVLLPGWPQTWWQFHKVMPALATRYRVIAVDLRGMGGSAKPAAGYDKKTLAADVHALARHLGYQRVDIAGHDIGAMVAYSFAANHPAATGKISLLDVTHPDEDLEDMTLLPSPGQFHLWWFAFNQVQGLPEELIAGRSRVFVDWFFDHIAIDPGAIGDADRAVYARAYSSADAIRAGNGYYQTFAQDIADQKAYGKVAAPILGLAGEFSYPSMSQVLPGKGTDVRVVKVTGSGHFLAEEQPQAVADSLRGFFG